MTVELIILQFSFLVCVMLQFHVYITFSLDSNYSLCAAIRKLKLPSVSDFLNSFSTLHPTEAAQKLSCHFQL